MKIHPSLLTQKMKPILENGSYLEELSQWKDKALRTFKMCSVVTLTDVVEILGNTGNALTFYSGEGFFSVYDQGGDHNMIITGNEEEDNCENREPIAFVISLPTFTEQYEEKKWIPSSWGESGIPAILEGVFYVNGRAEILFSSTLDLKSDGGKITSDIYSESEANIWLNNSEVSWEEIFEELQKLDVTAFIQSQKTPL